MQSPTSDSEAHTIALQLLVQAVVGTQRRHIHAPLEFRWRLWYNAVTHHSKLHHEVAETLACAMAFRSRANLRCRRYNLPCLLQL